MSTVRERTVTFPARERAPRMSVDTAMKHRDRACAEIRDALNHHHSHAHFLARVGNIWASLEKCPRWVRDYASGYLQARQSAMYETGALVWCVLEWEGVRYHRFAELPEEGKEFLRTRPREEAAALQFHYWKSTGVRF